MDRFKMFPGIFLALALEACRINLVLLRFTHVTRQKKTIVMTFGVFNKRNTKKGPG